MNKNEYVSVLRSILHDESEWVKVHAAEYLLWAGYPEGVKAMFLSENDSLGTKSPYRIGIWRVLAQSETDSAERKIWMEKIRNAFLDPNGADRIHAAETLAKLKIAPGPGNEPVIAEALKGNSALALYTLWSVSFSNHDALVQAPERLLSTMTQPLADTTTKTIMAYALRQMGPLPDMLWGQLAELALAEPIDSPAGIYLLSAALVTRPEAYKQEIYEKVKSKILRFSTSSSKGERSELAMALAERGIPADRTILEDMFNAKHTLGKAADDADVKAAAAFALLRMAQRESE